MSDYFGNRYWPERFWTVRYFMGGAQAPGSMSALLAGQSAIVAAVSYTGNNPVVEFSGGGFLSRGKPRFSLAVHVNPVVAAAGHARLSGASSVAAALHGAASAMTLARGVSRLSGTASLIDRRDNERLFWLLAA